jgi:hypothetical protein
MSRQAKALSTLLRVCSNLEGTNVEWKRVQLSVFVTGSGLISASTDQPLPLRSVVYSRRLTAFMPGFSIQVAQGFDSPAQLRSFLSLPFDCFNTFPL